MPPPPFHVYRANERRRVTPRLEVFTSADGQRRERVVWWSRGERLTRRAPCWFVDGEGRRWLDGRP